MNNEEKNLPETNVEENSEVNTENNKKLPTAALVGIIAGAVAVVTVIVILLVILLAPAPDNGSGCNPHMDKNDDYLCDVCGTHFDDGDEPVDPDANSTLVNFIVKLDDGTPVGGAVFSLVRGEDVCYTIMTGDNGEAKVRINYATYAIDIDYETLPEYCISDVVGIKVEEGTTEFVINVIDNRPDGTIEKPYPVLEELTEVTVEPGQELYFSYRGTSLKYVRISDPNFQINYNGETYSAVDGAVNATLLPENIGDYSIFSIRNVSDATVSTVLEVFAPEGSLENPVELVNNAASVTLSYEQIYHFAYVAEKDGELVLNTPTENNSITITRYMLVEVDNNGVTETIEVPVVAQTDGASMVNISVKEGEKIIIAVSYDFTDLGDGSEAVVEFSLEIVD